ncbi:MAG TPA: N(4)-(beta-N-acetylglucosaminyl)-L-asparaginase [Chthonomonadaceae bacterium]|nr:N(4)-(beta-N-acetylglucosaminyl)-L-asparaginase [Chthonomonadaceae bacterium]
MAVEPVIVATWRFGVPACQVGWERLAAGASVLDAVEAGANVVEEDPAVTSVGYGGLPNAEGIVELDAAIMDGATHAAGSVAGLTSIRRPISVARRVMERTPHVLLVGQNARRFALQEGFPEAELLTPESRDRWLRWRLEQSAPDVAHFEPAPPLPPPPTPEDHDTIGLCALDRQGDLAAGCTTSGLAWKRPGRVGDSPIIGSGLYVDNAVGACAATGQGDEIMKACLSYRVVLLMEQGRTAQEACEESLRYLLRKRPPEQHNHYGAALIAIRKDGLVGAAGTLSGFHAPDRLWQWALARSSEVVLNAGPYVTLEGTHLHLTA